MPATAVASPGDEIPWPAYSETIDYELELAVVIGRKVKAVAIDRALEAIAGYTIVNDVSARTVTFKKSRAERPWDEFYDWLNGKWADGFCPMVAGSSTGTKGLLQALRFTNDITHHFAGTAANGSKSRIPEMS